MNSLLQQSFGINLKILKTWNMYSSRKPTVWSYLTYLYFTVHVPLLGILYFILKDIEISQIGETAFPVAQLTCNVYKLLPFITRRDKIKKCIEEVNALVLFQSREKHKKIIENCINSCRRMSKIFLIFVTIGFTMWILKPLCFSEYVMPLEVWLPFEPKDHKILFYLVYLYICLGSAYTVIPGTAIDPMVAGFACLIAGQVSVLKDNLEHLYEYTKEDIHKYEFGRLYLVNKYIISKIQECIEHHNAIFKFTKDFESCFSQVVFSQLITSIFVLGFCCLQLTVLEPLTVDFFVIFFFLLAFLTQIFFYSYYGSLLYEESNNLTDAIYMGRWYEYDMKSKKAIIIMMQCCQQPIHITVGKVLDMSLLTFMTIIKKSYSVLALLNNQK